MSVLVVGAGPVGLHAAIVLRLWGCDVRVIDRKPAPPVASRALAPQPMGMEALQRLGLAASLEARSLRLASSALFNERSFLGRIRSYPQDSRFPHTCIGSQAALDRLLAERLDELGVAVEWGRECTGLEQDWARVRVAGLNRLARTAGDGRAPSASHLSPA